jgi:SH3-like domain-containing protein
MPADSRMLWRILFVCGLLFAAPAAAQESVAPHFASIRRDPANMREGPSYAHRILWLYRRKNYPVWVLSAYGEWRHVRDPDGAVGWMHHTQLSDKRSVLFTGRAKTPLRDRADGGGKIVAYAAPGVVAWLKACEPSTCEVEVQGIDGWADKNALWGIAPGDVFR